MVAFWRFRTLFVGDMFLYFFFQLGVESEERSSMNVLEIETEKQEFVDLLSCLLYTSDAADDPEIV